VQTDINMSAKAQVRPRARQRMHWRKVMTPYLFLLPYMIAFLVFQAVPFVTGIALSFMRWELLERSQSFIGLQNFTDVFADDLFWQSFRNSFYFAVLTTAGVAVVALGLARRRRRATV